MHENIYFIVNALFFLGVVAALVFVVLTAIGSGFDMIQRRAYRNKKKWDRCVSALLIGDVDRAAKEIKYEGIGSRSECEELARAIVRVGNKRFPSKEEIATRKEERRRNSKM